MQQQPSFSQLNGRVQVECDTCDGPSSRRQTSSILSGCSTQHGKTLCVCTPISSCYQHNCFNSKVNHGSIHEWMTKTAMFSGVRCLYCFALVSTVAVVEGSLFCSHTDRKVNIDRLMTYTSTFLDIHLDLTYFPTYPS